MCVNSGFVLDLLGFTCQLVFMDQLAHIPSNALHFRAFWSIDGLHWIFVNNYLTVWEWKVRSLVLAFNSRIHVCPGTVYNTLTNLRKRMLEFCLVAQWIFSISFDWIDKCFPKVSTKAEGKFTFQVTTSFSFGSSQTFTTCQWGCLYQKFPWHECPGEQWRYTTLKDVYNHTCDMG